MIVRKIKNLWKRIKKRWDDCGSGDEYDASGTHLSQSDKQFLLYGNIISCTCTVALVLLITGISRLQLSHQNYADMEEIINAIKSYVGSATADEYDEIVQTIRHDLVFSDYDEDIDQYIRYIPNASEECCACMRSYPAGAVIISLNTGESYSLDLSEREINSEVYNSTRLLTFGFDEISQTSIRISKDTGENEGLAELKRGNGIVSIHKMKNLFCDDCIRNLLDTIENQVIEEVVIFDTEKNIFYPIEEGTTIQIGENSLKIEYRNHGYEIAIKHVDEIK